MIELSKRATLLKPSPTLAMAAKARELAAQGKKVISLTVGEPDWPTFESANQAGIEAIRQGFTKYTASQGIVELRKAIADQVRADFQLDYSNEEVIVASGAKYVIYALMQMLVNPGDEVVIPAPYWVSYPTIAELAGGVARILECSESSNFKMTAEGLSKVLNPRSKVLIFSSPSNPTGLAYSKEEWLALAEVIRKNPQLVVISDDIYDKLIFSHSPSKVSLSSGLNRAMHLLDVAPDLKNQVIIVNGASKTYSMTGWRVGWALGPKALMKATSDFLSQTTSNVTSIAQKAVLAALLAGPQELKAAVEKLENKKNIFLSESKKFKFLKVVPPDGAFYFWLDVRGLFARSLDGKLISNSRILSEILLEKYHLAVVPGIEFGCEGYLRVSIAASEKDLAEAWSRLQKLEADSSV